MPKNIKGGNKAKKGANKNVQQKKSKDDTPLPDENDRQYIGQVIKVHGDCRYDAKIINKNANSDKELMIHLPGSMRRKCRVILRDVVLISRREFENKGDILYLYNGDDKEYLISKGYVFEKYDITSQNEMEEERDEDDLGFKFTKSSVVDTDKSEFDIDIEEL